MSPSLLVLKIYNVPIIIILFRLPIFKRWAKRTIFTFPLYSNTAARLYYNTYQGDLPSHHRPIKKKKLLLNINNIIHYYYKRYHSI